MVYPVTNTVRRAPEAMQKGQARQFQWAKGSLWKLLRYCLGCTYQFNGFQQHKYLDCVLPNVPQAQAVGFARSLLAQTRFSACYRSFQPSREYDVWARTGKKRARLR